MRRLKYLFLLLPLGLLFLNGCREDSDIIDTNITSPEPEVIITTEVEGRVMDDNGIAVVSAAVSMGNLSTATDENGYFQLVGQGTQTRETLTVTKSGYFNSNVSFAANRTAKSRVKVVLQERVSSGEISSSSGGEIVINNGGSIQFTSESFVMADGNPYEGTVTVYASVIDPTDDRVAEIVPGDFLAIDDEQNMQQLASFAMLNVELEGQNGEELDINKSAQINFQVPAELINDAPQTIPLWYFDEGSGLWVEEGQAELVGNSYKGSVDHFTLWNCDIPFPYITMQGQVVMEAGGVPFLSIKVTSETQGTAYTTTDAGGFFGGKVPAGETLRIQIFNECGQVIYDEEHGPFDQDTDIGIIWIVTSNNWRTVSGRVLDCDGQPVSSGYVLVVPEGGNSQFINTESDGTFSELVATCNANSLNATPYDIASLEFGAESQFAIMTSDISTGDLVACGNQITEGVTMVLNGVDYFIPVTGTQVVDDSTATGASLYNISATDIQDVGDVIYHFLIFSEANGSPNNTLLAVSWEIFERTGTPIWYDIGSCDDGEILQDGSQPGETFEYYIDPCDLMDSAGQTYDNSSVRILAILD